MSFCTNFKMLTICDLSKIFKCVWNCGQIRIHFIIEFNEFGEVIRSKTEIILISVYIFKLKKMSPVKKKNQIISIEFQNRVVEFFFLKVVSLINSMGLRLWSIVHRNNWSRWEICRGIRASWNRHYVAPLEVDLSASGPKLGTVTTEVECWPHWELHTRKVLRLLATRT